MVSMGVNSAYAKIRKFSLRFSGFQGAHARNPRLSEVGDFPAAAHRKTSCRIVRRPWTWALGGCKETDEKKPGTFRPPG